MSIQPYIRKAILISALMLSLSALHATAQSFEWVQTAGTTMQYAGALARKIQVDAAGNTYVVGNFLHNVIFDGREFESTSPLGNPDVYLAKYDKGGRLSWVRRYGGKGGEDAIDFALDPQGNVYIVGFFTKANPGDNHEIGGASLHLDGSDREFFLAKLSPSGDLVWLRQSYDSGLARPDWPQIAVDPLGNVIFQGTFKGEMRIGSTVLKNDGRSVGLFVVKLSPAGEVLWGNTQVASINFLEGPDQLTRDFVEAAGLTTDASGNIYYTGIFRGTLSFKGEQVRSKAQDVYLVKLDPDGRQAWHRVVSGYLGETSMDVEVDVKGNPHLLLYAVDPEVGGIRANNGAGTYVAKFDGSGKPYQVSSIIEEGFCPAIAIDGNGRVYATGYISGTAKVGDQVLNLSTGEAEAVVICQDREGRLEWVRQAGGPGFVMGTDIQLDGAGSAYVLGEFRGDISFDDLQVRTKAASRPETKDFYTIDMVVARMKLPVSVTQVSIPNIFTPNGDGVNDVFTVANLPKDSPVRMRIYSRWGTLVADLKDGTKGWEAYNSAEGLYFYNIEIAGELKKGWVELVR
ncbi:hypothetical protein TH61_17385 [Rufibacter sp. DG15C]|uniref:T9SS type B sorting domain-containing protein n=1 Tax=Rufibacter sp. DG15C TaxID=1379909 RepID=UPI00078C05DC|nr:gliding motility-associated C-terminal domain-containing protein [Rufibacter sp. DG15C]AMM52599.1 hypothetical protein TH61_17385 [Rufibacter sp. DG15C]